MSGNQAVCAGFSNIEFFKEEHIMKRTVIQKLLPLTLMSAFIGSVSAGATYDPTFEPNLRPAASQKIVQASDGGYFLSGGGMQSGWEESLPCTPAYATAISVSGYDGLFNVSGRHFLYLGAKLTEQGKMDCNFQLPLFYPKPPVLLPDGEGKIYAVAEFNAMSLYDAYNGAYLLHSPYHIARFSEDDGKLDGYFVFGPTTTNREYVGDFAPLSTFGWAYNLTHSVAIDDNGPFRKLVLGGMYQTRTGDEYYSVWRLNHDGSWDSSFQPVRINWPSVSGAKNARVNKIQVLPSGKILFGGTNVNNVEGEQYGNLIQLNADGSIDTDFMNALTENGAHNGVGGNRLYDIAVQPDGKIIVVGQRLRMTTASGDRYGVFRINPDGTRDETFTPPAFIANSPWGVDDINSVALQGDGKIILATSRTTYDHASGQSTLMRLNTDGTMDDTFRVKIVMHPAAGGVYGATFDRECRLMVAFDGAWDTTLPTVEFPLTGQVSPPVPGLVRLLVDGAQGCVH